MKFMKNWWWRLIGMHWYNLMRSGRSTRGTEDLRVRAWREKHFSESMRANWRIFVGEWSSLFDWCYPKQIQSKRHARRTFQKMNHPAAATRQLAEWKRLGPQNPPPAVRHAVSAMQSPEMAAARVRASQILD